MTCWEMVSPFSSHKILAAEQVGALGHEMHAAEDDVPGLGLGGDLGELVAVAGRVGEADNFVALVVVAEQEHLLAELGASLGDSPSMV